MAFPMTKRKTGQTGNKVAKSVRYIIASLVTVPDEEYFLLLSV